jgi:hypothetical protein
MNSVSKQRTLGRRRKQRRGSAAKIVLGIVVALTGFLIAAICLFYFGQVSGTEFSPQSFTIRRFSYRRMPYFHWRMSRTQHDGNRFLCDQTILKRLTNQLSQNKSFQWHLINAQAGGAIIAGDASILTSYFGNSNEFNWTEWSSKHSEASKTLWPAIQELAIYQCYWAIPELLELARQDQPLVDFQSATNALLDKSCVQHAENLVSAQKWNDAKIALTWVAERVPDSKVLDEAETVDDNSDLDAVLALDVSPTPMESAANAVPADAYDATAGPTSSDTTAQKKNSSTDADPSKSDEFKSTPIDDLPPGENAPTGTGEIESDFFDNIEG